MRDYLVDVAAERAVLASVFQFGSEAYDDIADIVTPRTFTEEGNQAIWRCVEHILQDQVPAIDYSLVMSAANTLGVREFFKTDSDIRHLRSLFNMPIQRQTGRRMAARIRKFEVAHLLESQLEVARKKLRGLSGDESINEIAAIAEQPIFDFTSLLTDTVSIGCQKMGENAVAHMTHLMDNPRDMVGISTGLPLFDESIGGGLRPGSLDIILARMKVGKTQIADNVGMHIAGVESLPVNNIDTEMTLEEHQMRIIANLAGIPVREIETGKCGLRQFDRKKVLDAAAKLESLPYYYECVSGRGFEEILASLRRWVTRVVGLDSNGKAKPCAVIYDYIKMLGTDFVAAEMKEYQALGFITTALKNFMGRYGVTCLCFTQANREGIDGEETNAVGGSDRIAQYATSLTMYKLKTDEERADAPGDGRKYTHKLIPIIGRHGAGLADGDYINVHAEYGQARVTEGPTKFQLERGSSSAASKQPKGFEVSQDEQPTAF